MLSLDAARQSLHDTGYVDLEDSETGRLVAEMEKRKFRYLSPYGLEYCERHILKDERIQEIIKHLLGHCSLGHWLRYRALPGHIECFRKGGREAGLRVLVVHQLAKGSSVEYYPGSHLLNLPTIEGLRSLEETTRDALLEARCLPDKKDYPNGGLVIRDARLCTEIKEGYAITFIFATDDALATWPKIMLPNSPELIRTIVKMETEHIRVNFAIQSPAASPTTT